MNPRPVILLLVYILSLLLTACGEIPIPEGTQVTLTPSDTPMPPTDTVTVTVEPTETPTPSLTPVPTKIFELYQISGRPPEELTFCSPDAKRPAGIRIIARWPAQGKKGFYIAAQQGMRITHFRVDGWDFLPSTNINIFPYPDAPSGICGYEAKWLAWSDPNASDPEAGSRITVDFLGDNGNAIVKVAFTVNQDGLGITTSSLEY